MKPLLLTSALVVALVSPALAQKQPAKPANKTAVERSGADKTPDTAKQGPADIAYGAYQRGHFLAAFNEAANRAKDGDVKAMTLLGELYANGQGVARNDEKAAQWYRLAAERGDREAMFALGTFELDGRGGPRNREHAMKLFTEAAKLGNASAAYNVGLASLEPSGDPKIAAHYLTIAAKAGLPEAQYALSVMYREGRGVPKDPKEAVRLLQQAASAEYLDAMVEFAIATFNGSDIRKDETAGVALLHKAALRGSPIAQNRLAYAYTLGRGIAVDPVQAVKWHLAAKTGGVGDPRLDEYAAKQTPEVRSEAEKGVKPWLDYYKTLRN